MVGAAFLSLAAPAFAQTDSPQGDSYASIAKLPDWSGAFEPVLGKIPGRPANGTPSFTEAWKPKIAKIDAIHAASGDVPSRVYHCIPSGFPGGLAAPTRLYEFLYTPGQVLMLVQNDDNRRIYTDGRPHPPNPRPSFFGHSIGHWEGDTLVVDTVGLDPGNEFLYGVPGGENMHTVEHIHLTNNNMLAIDTVLEAPDALTEPYRYTFYFRRGNWTIGEEFCTQNNRDVSADTGVQIFNQAPPPLKPRP
jgi:hypothetical protein